ncbi:membrane protein insertion efficiency factor YidD [Patescibacteria group bacterium]|nr:membrane protein insertion efficiency factor YidD [Patescibacteria group bacterium]
MARIVIYLIKIYQKSLSPDHGWFKHRHPQGYCKYYPSCSEYTKQSVQKYGIFGLFKGFFRVLRCNPWSKGGVDLA